MQRFYTVLTLCSVLFAAAVGNADQNVVTSDKLTPRKCCIDLFSSEIALKFEVMFRTGKYDFKPVGALKQTALHYAAVQNNARQVQKCLELGADVNAKNYLGRTPLTALLSSTYELDGSCLSSFSIRSVDFTNVVDILLCNGADVSVSDNIGKTAIDYAIYQGNLDIVKNLIKHGAKLPTDRPEWSGILAENIDYSPEMIQFLIDRGADVNGKKRRESVKLQTRPDFPFQPGNNYYPLYIQIERNNWSAANCLIAAGADVNAQNTYGQTALHAAAEEGSLEMVMRLVDCGADLHATDETNWTVLHFAVQSGNPQLVQWLIEQGLDVNAKNDGEELPIDKIFNFRSIKSLDKRELKNTVDLVNLLLDNGSPINDNQKNNWKWVVLAYRCNDLYLLKKLATRGLNVKEAFQANCRDEDDHLDILRKTPCELLAPLANKQKTEQQKAILKFILDQNIVPDKKKPALFNDAVSNKQYKLADLLFENWKDVLNPHVIYISDDNSSARFDKDLFLGDVIIVDLRTNDINKRYKKAGQLTPDQMQWFTDRGVDPYLPGERRQNVLFQAVECNNLDLIKYFAKQGADMNVKDEDGQTLLFFADKWETIKCLIDAGVDPNAQNLVGGRFFNGRYFYEYEWLTLNRFKYIYSLIQDDIQDDKHFFSDTISAWKESVFLGKQRIQIVHWLVLQGYDLRELDNATKETLILDATLFSDNSPDYFDFSFDNISPRCLRHIKRQISQIDFFRAPKSLTEQGLALALSPVQWEALNVSLQIANNLKNSFSNNCDLSEFRFLIQHGIFKNKEVVDRAFNAHIFRFIYNEYELRTIQILLDYGADVNIYGSFAWACLLESPGTLLDCALRSGDLEMTQDLIRRGAKYIKNDSDKTVLTEGVYQCPNPELINWLIRQPDCLNYIKRHPATFIKSALLEGNYLLIQIVLDNGFNLKKVLDKYSDRILSDIVKMGSPMDIQWLVDHGVDVKKASVIFYAVKCNRLDMVKALIKCGAKLDVVVKEGSFTHTNKGVTLAHAAAQCGDLEMVKFLADNGVDFNAVDSKGNAPIHAASKYGNVQILEYLLDRGADVNAKNDDGETPLDIAEKESMEDAVEILKEYQKKKQAAEGIQK